MGENQLQMKYLTDKGQQILITMLLHCCWIPMLLTVFVKTEQAMTSLLMPAGHGLLCLPLT